MSGELLAAESRAWARVKIAADELAAAREEFLEAQRAVFSEGVAQIRSNQFTPAESQEVAKEVFPSPAPEPKESISGEVRRECGFGEIDMGPAADVAQFAKDDSIALLWTLEGSDGGTDEKRVLHATLMVLARRIRELEGG